MGGSGRAPNETFRAGEINVFRSWERVYTRAHMCVCVCVIHARRELSAARVVYAERR